jgi:hypothetical protein
MRNYINKAYDKVDDKKEIIDQIYRVKTDIHNLNSKLDKLIEYYLGEIKTDIVDTFCNGMENGVITYEPKLRLETLYKMLCSYEYMYNQNGWEEEYQKQYGQLEKDLQNL